MAITAKKTKAQLEAEVPEGAKRLSRRTKVVATAQGYYDTIREPGDVFYMNEGTILRSGSWAEEVSEDTTTGEEQDSIDGMSIGEIKIELARLKIDFKGVTKKDELGELLIKSRKGEIEDEDLA